MLPEGPKQLQNMGTDLGRLLGGGGLFKLFKACLRFVDHPLRVLHADGFLDLFAAERTGHHLVHDGVHILLETDIIIIHKGDIAHDSVVGIAVSAEHNQKKKNNPHKRHDNHAAHDRQFPLQIHILNPLVKLMESAPNHASSLISKKSVFFSLLRTGILS